jgi:hypothetical protein
MLGSRWNEWIQKRARNRQVEVMRSVRFYGDRIVGKVSQIVMRLQ